MFKNLIVYQIAEKLEKQVKKIANSLPKNEFILRSQILRSSRSIRANIAEGYGRKRYQKELCKFLNYALASSDETQVHLDIIFDSNLINEKFFPTIKKDYKNLSVRLLNFIKKAENNINPHLSASIRN